MNCLPVQTAGNSNTTRATQILRPVGRGKTILEESVTITVVTPRDRPCFHVNGSYFWVRVTNMNNQPSHCRSLPPPWVQDGEEKGKKVPCTGNGGKVKGGKGRMDG